MEGESSMSGQDGESPVLQEILERRGNHCRICDEVIPKGQVHCGMCRLRQKEARDRAPDRDTNDCPKCHTPITLATARSKGMCPACYAKSQRLHMKDARPQTPRDTL